MQPLKRSNRSRSIIKCVLKNFANSQESTSATVSFLIILLDSACSFIKKDTNALVFSCEFCEVFKNNIFTEHLWATTSVNN